MVEGKQHNTYKMQQLGKITTAGQLCCHKETVASVVSFYTTIPILLVPTSTMPSGL